jgi:hypothetical protein
MDKVDRKCVGCGKIDNIIRRNGQIVPVFCRSCSKKDQYRVFRWIEVKKKIDSAYKKGFKAGQKEANTLDGKQAYFLRKLYQALNIYNRGDDDNL